jgi:hypothetical protein
MLCGRIGNTLSPGSHCADCGVPLTSDADVGFIGRSPFANKRPLNGGAEQQTRTLLCRRCASQQLEAIA